MRMFIWEDSWMQLLQTTEFKYILQFQSNINYILYIDMFVSKLRAWIKQQLSSNWAATKQQLAATEQQLITCHGIPCECV